MRSLASVVGALFLVGCVSATGAASGPVPAARTGRLAGTTTITWTGTAGIALDVRRTALLKDADADLLVDGGTYAFVRILGAPRSDCPPEIGPYCVATSISYMRAIHDPPLGSRARSHWVATPDPAHLEAPRIGVYLFTDGRATLTLRTNLSGRSAYRATGRVRGRASLLPRECAPAPCSATPAGSNTISYGGLAHDLGSRGGWAEYLGGASNAAGAEDANQLHGINGCLYPNPVSPQISAQPSAYPYGCGIAPANADQAYPSIVGEINGAPGFGNVRGNSLWWTAARGKQYIGFRAKSVGTVGARHTAFGIWFNIGIA